MDPAADAGGAPEPLGPARGPAATGWPVPPATRSSLSPKPPDPPAEPPGAAGARSLAGSGSRPPGARAAVAAGFVVLFTCTGVNFAFGILFKSILVDLASDRSTLALAATASLLVNALSQPILGALVDRFGPRRVILPSMLLMAAGTALVALSQRPWQVIALYGVVAAVGYAGAGILPVSVHVTRWVPGERGFAVAIAACGFSVGHLVFTQVAAHAAVALGWRATYVLLGAVVAVVLVGMLAWLRDAPGRPARSPADAGPAAPSLGAAGADLDRRAALRTAGFWAMTIGLMGCGFTDFLMTTHLPAFSTDLGLSPATAANAVSLWAAANVAGILAAGGVAARMGPRLALVLTYAVRATALFLLLGVRGPWELYAVSILFGATFFTTAPLSATMVGQLFGPRHQGAIFGLANLFHHSAGALGSWAGGVAFDLTGGYGGIFLAGAVIVVGSALSSSLARAPGARR